MPVLLTTVLGAAVGFATTSEAATPAVELTIEAPARAVAGTVISVSVTATNQTSSTLTGLELAPDVPNVVGGLSGCTEETREIFCPVPDLPAGSSATYQFSTLIPPASSAGSLTIAPSLGTFGPTAISTNAVEATVAVSASAPGYDLIASDGGVFTYGSKFFGSLGAIHLNEPIVGATAAVNGDGYYLLGADGGIFAFGNAPFYGSGVGLIAGPAAAVTTDASGDYYIATASGAVWKFAPGVTPTKVFSISGPLNSPIVGIAVTPDGGEIYLAAADGGVFINGSGFLGSLAATPLPHPIVGIALVSNEAAPALQGYRLVDSAGTSYLFGIGNGSGTPTVTHLPVTPNQPIVGVVSDPVTFGNGYWLFAADGGVFSGGGAPFLGSAGAIHLNQPIVAGVLESMSPYTQACDINFCGISTS